MRNEFCRQPIFLPASFALPASPSLYRVMGIYGDTEVDARPLEGAIRQVVLDAIATAKKLPWIDAKRFYVYGFSRGAVVAAALINQMDGVKGALLQSGAYDLPGFTATLPASGCASCSIPTARLNPNC